VFTTRYHFCWTTSFLSDETIIERGAEAVKQFFKPVFDGYWSRAKFTVTWVTTPAGAPFSREGL